MPDNDGFMVLDKRWDTFEAWRCGKSGSPPEEVDAFFVLAGEATLEESNTTLRGAPLAADAPLEAILASDDAFALSPAQRRQVYNHWCQLAQREQVEELARASRKLQARARLCHKCR